ncbi:MAG: MarR family winged helix-turn-helix transcriptional regulator [Fimbriimonadaceae bacterium]|nr:MarR family winged helix-turn-helix transcriptional regulator [Alphaproteobacteria bacterium]
MKDDMEIIEPSAEQGSGCGEKSDQCLDLPTFFPYRLSVVEIAVSRAIARLYTDRLGLSRVEWRAFAALGDLQPTAAVEIARYTGLDKMQLTRAISRLTDEGLVERVSDARDKRRVVLHLTALGKRTLCDMIPKARAREAFILAALTDDERLVLTRLLEKVEARALTLDEQG